MSTATDSLPTRRPRPNAIRFPVFTDWRANPYVDLRVYRAGYPTRNGLPIHRDLLPAVL